MSIEDLIWRKLFVFLSKVMWLICVIQVLSYSENQESSPTNQISVFFGSRFQKPNRTKPKTEPNRKPMKKNEPLRTLIPIMKKYENRWWIQIHNFENYCFTPPQSKDLE